MASQVFTHDMPPLPLFNSKQVSERLEELFRAIEDDLTTRLGLPIKDATREMQASVINPDR